MTAFFTAHGSLLVSVKHYVNHHHTPPLKGCGQAKSDGVDNSPLERGQGEGEIKCRHIYALINNSGQKKSTYSSAGAFFAIRCKRML